MGAAWVGGEPRAVFAQDPWSQVEPFEGRQEWSSAKMDRKRSDQTAMAKGRAQKGRSPQSSDSATSWLEDWGGRRHSKTVSFVPTPTVSRPDLTPSAFHNCLHRHKEPAQ